MHCIEILIVCCCSEGN